MTALGHSFLEEYYYFIGLYEKRQEQVEILLCFCELLWYNMCKGRRGMEQIEDLRVCALC